MRSLSLDQLRTFETVIGLASFTAAARRLNLSQSTVSVQIRELERRYGVTLIERMGKKAYATPSGQALAEAAQRIFHECESAEAALRRFRDGWIGRVHVGTTNTALMYHLPPILRHQAKPNAPALEIVRKALLGLRDAGELRPARTRANGAGRGSNSRPLRRAGKQGAVS